MRNTRNTSQRREEISMKKILAVLLAAIMCLSLCACGANNDTTKTSANETTEQVKEENKIYKLGDAIETKLFRITPAFTGYARYLSNVQNETYLTFTGSTVNNPYVAEDGKVNLFGEMAVEYVGTEKSNVSLEVDISVDFDNGYIYSTDELGSAIDCTISPDKDDWDSSIVFEPFGETKGLVRYCIQAPEQVESESEKPLIATITVNGEKFLFDFRSAEVCGSKYSTRSDYYKPIDDATKKQIISCLKESELKETGWFAEGSYNSVGTFTFDFGDKDVKATLPNMYNTNYEYEFEGTYEVYSGTILIDWSYGEQMHLDYVFKDGKIEITDFEHGV